MNRFAIALMVVSLLVIVAFGWIAKMEIDALDPYMTDPRFDYQVQAKAVEDSISAMGGPLVPVEDPPDTTGAYMMGSWGSVRYMPAHGEYARYGARGLEKGNYWREISAKLDRVIGLLEAQNEPED